MMKCAITEFSIDGYQTFVNDNPKRGAIIYVKNDLVCTQLTKFATTDREMDVVWVETSLQKN